MQNIFGDMVTAYEKEHNLKVPHTTISEPTPIIRK